MLLYLVAISLYTVARLYQVIYIYRLKLRFFTFISNRIYLFLGMSVILEILPNYDYVCHRLRKLGKKYRLGLVSEIILFNFYREKYG